MIRLTPYEWAELVKDAADELAMGVWPDHERISGPEFMRRLRAHVGEAADDVETGDPEDD